MVSYTINEASMSLPVFPATPTDAGITRQVLSHSPEIMVVSFRFESGAEGRLHSHPHVQSTYVARGRFRFFRDGVAYELNPGDSLVIPETPSTAANAWRRESLSTALRHAGTTSSDRLA